jgi:Zn-finger nucleic acid-binding protein
MFVPASKFYELLASEDVPAGESSAEDRDSSGGRCPRDRTIMARAAINAGGQMIHLDRCSGCHGVWFDAGEWSTLAANHLLEHIDEFWSAEWRSSQRKALEHEEYQRRLNDTFGAELLGQIRSLATTLRNDPRRSQALALLREESSAAYEGATRDV